ncbi:dihydrofolate reductase family protein [Sphaerobacter thermophilus]|jgi:dihydrofolate reductase|uniref:Bifunctional deaminase-reductase domain protein n=1 Tax=Sphaerobacter thermophilus (strain ATCC 49802 / DSM 20745 / KCCM 41009 / NCIMB 13125 / S 6022) TaxID=479434 RepID=D1C981_SPHTD|nr:dihydrofolate reductase family protein [Sphaerobacter thermophilus]ACZ40374.1 bifunctional deaminase-reductase domain protein [Sphaerobacter thermophilus DSM 20745]PZN63692.1 MAG: dihydrofolate reductase [Sphaerobacter thermophilus]
MRTVVYGMMVTIDGFIEGPNHQLDWPIIDDELHEYVNEQQRSKDTYVLGRRLYEMMEAFWPTADQDPSAPPYIVEFARIWRDTPKVVFSKTLDQVGPNARLVRDDVVDEVARLKQQPGKDIDVGGASIAASLMRHDLIDEYHLFIHPVVLGGGTPMFPALSDQRLLRLIDMRTFRSGVVFLRYQPADAEHVR